MLHPLKHRGLRRETTFGGTNIETQTEATEDQDTSTSVKVKRRIAEKALNAVKDKCS